jgi:hypothetical protein
MPAMPRVARRDMRGRAQGNYRKVGDLMGRYARSAKIRVYEAWSTVHSEPCSCVPVCVPMPCMRSSAISVYLRASAVDFILSTKVVADYDAASDSSQSIKLAVSAVTASRAARVTT